MTTTVVTVLNTVLIKYCMTTTVRVCNLVFFPHALKCPIDFKEDAISKMLLQHYIIIIYV